MCGIYGQFNLHGADPALIERMAHCLQHRGPDGYGTYHTGPLAFGAGRLAIIDLAAGTQPIFSEDRQVAVIYNGEIYNYKALRAELEVLGHRFATQTDTEVIVHGYETWGIDVLCRLRGMFALGIWDESNGYLWLARDRLGEKPLYYTTNTDNFLFASEIKALLEDNSLLRKVNSEALPYYLTLGYVPPPLTMFQGIEKLAPGEFLRISREGVCKQQYWQPHMDTSAPISYVDAVRQVRQALIEAVEMRLMSDVPIGAFLSGGLDSTAVVAIMARALRQPIRTFTVGFAFAENGEKAERKYNVDARYATLASRRFKTDHHTLLIKEGPHLATQLTQLIYAMDEPIAQPAIIQTAYVSALARQNGVPVLLTGDAGDELFAGYHAYRADQVLTKYLRLPGVLRNNLLTPLMEHLPARFDALHKLASKSRVPDSVHRYLTWMKIMELDSLPGILANRQLATSAYKRLDQILRPLLDSPRTPHFADRIAFTSLNLWLPEDSNMRVDKMSMAMSVESRAPFEDHKLVELALRIPLEHKLRQGDFKAVLKSAVADLVPPEILAREKWGFRPPISEWLRTHFRPLIENYLSPKHVLGEYFQPEAVSRIVEAHIAKHQYELWSLWPLLVFHLWHALYIDGSLTLDHKLAPADFLISAN